MNTSPHTQSGAGAGDASYTFSVLCAAALILSFASITYELLLGQALSAFLGNTVLRYSVTVGLYLFSMGVGALAAERWFAARRLFTRLLSVEFALILLGASSVMFLYGASAVVPEFFFSLLAHAMIIIIGVLTGFELPLLMEMSASEGTSRENAILGMSYLGALAGSFVFALFLYPKVGLVGTALLAALANTAAVLFLVLSAKKRSGERCRIPMYAAGAFGIFLIAGLFAENALTEILTRVYLGA